MKFICSLWKSVFGSDLWVSVCLMEKQSEEKNTSNRKIEWDEETQIEKLSLNYSPFDTLSQGEFTVICGGIKMFYALYFIFFFFINFYNFYFLIYNFFFVLSIFVFDLLLVLVKFNFLFFKIVFIICFFIKFFISNFLKPFFFLKWFIYVFLIFFLSILKYLISFNLFFFFLFWKLLVACFYWSWFYVI